MAELIPGPGLDPSNPRFSTNFLELDATDMTSANGSSTVPQPSESTARPIQTNPFRSESPTPSDPGLQLDHNAPGFDFAAHLETRDSISSLDQVGILSPTPDSNVSPVHQSGVNGVSTDYTDQVGSSGANAEGKTPPTLVARTSEHWETFDENGQRTSEPHPPTANGGHSASGGEDKEKAKEGQWCWYYGGVS